MAGETEHDYDNDKGFFKDNKKPEKKKVIKLPVDQNPSAWANYNEENYDPCGIN